MYRRISLSWKAVKSRNLISMFDSMTGSAEKNWFSGFSWYVTSNSSFYVHQLLSRNYHQCELSFIWNRDYVRSITIISLYLSVGVIFYSLIEVHWRFHLFRTYHQSIQHVNIIKRNGPCCSVSTFVSWPWLRWASVISHLLDQSREFSPLYVCCCNAISPLCFRSVATRTITCLHLQMYTGRDNAHAYRSIFQFYTFFGLVGILSIISDFTGSFLSK